MYLKATIMLVIIFVGMNCNAEPLATYDGFVANLDEKTQKKCQKNTSGTLIVNVELLTEKSKDYLRPKNFLDLGNVIKAGVRKQCPRIAVRYINIIGRAKDAEPYFIFIQGAKGMSYQSFFIPKHYSMKYSRYSRQTCERKPGSVKIKKHESILKFEKLTGVIFGRPFYGDPVTRGKPSFYAEVVKVCPGSVFAESDIKEGDLVDSIYIGEKEVKIVDALKAGKSYSIQHIVNDDYLTEVNGATKFHLFRMGAGRIDMQANLNIDRAKEAVLAKKTAAQQRKMRIVNTLQAVARKPLPFKYLDSLKRPNSKTGLVPDNSFVNKLKPFGKIQIDPRTYAIQGVVSNGRKYSIDEIIIGFNMLYYNKTLYKFGNDPRIKIRQLDLNNNSLLFKDDSGEVYLAAIDHSDEKYPTIFDKRFSVLKIKQQEIKALKSLIRKEGLPYRANFYEEKLEPYAYYDIMRGISPAFDSIFKEGDISCRGAYGCVDILSILNNDVPKLASLLENIKNKDRYFQYIHKYDGKADAFLVPLISLAPLPEEVPTERFIASQPLLPKVDYYHEKHLWEQRRYYDAAKRDGYVYKNPFYWSQIIQPNQREYSFFSDGVRYIFQGNFPEGSWRYANERLFDTVTSYFNIKKSNCPGSYAMPPVVFNSVLTRTLTDGYGNLKDSRSYKSKVYIGRRFTKQYKWESEQIYPRDPASKNRVYDQITDEIAGQMNRLVMRDGCKSATVRHFEENLYRDFTGLSSLQKARKRIRGASGETDNANDLSRIDSIFKSCMKNNFHGMESGFGEASKVDNKCACFEKVATNALASKSISASEMKGYIANFEKFKALDFSRYTRNFHTSQYGACNSGL